MNSINQILSGLCSSLLLSLQLDLIAGKLMRLGCLGDATLGEHRAHEVPNTFPSSFVES